MTAKHSAPICSDAQPSFNCLSTTVFIPLAPCGASPVDPSLTHRIPWISWLLRGSERGRKGEWCLSACPPTHPTSCLLPTGVPVFSSGRKEAQPSDQLTDFYVVMHRFTAGLNEDTVSSLDRVTLPCCRSAPAKRKIFSLNILLTLHLKHPQYSRY